MTSSDPFTHAQSLHQSGNFAAAEAAYRQVLAINPHHTAALAGLSEVLYRTGQNNQALNLIKNAADSFPTDPAIQLTYGIILDHEGRFDQAIAVYQALIALRPDLAEAYSRMATPLLATGHANQAIDACQRSLSLRPDHMPTLLTLCNALSGVGDLDQVVQLCRSALARQPNFRTFYVNLGWALREQGKLDEAIACYRDALSRGPHRLIYDDLLFTLHFHPQYGRAELFREHRHWAEHFAKPQAPEIPMGPHDHSSDRKLRLGYVAHDLGNNPLGRFLLPMLENHDRSAFEVFVYCDRRRTDAVGDRLVASVNAWRSTGALTDERLAELIRADGIDILVDLIMHSNGSRLLAFARKPAPVQVTYLAYASTTGLDAIDCRLTDRYLDPPGSDQWYSEKSVYLPNGYWCYPPPAEAPAIVPPPAFANGYITFGCLNEFSKVTPQVLAIYCDILRQIPNSRLLLHAKPGSQRAIAHERAATAGIDPSRIDFVGRLPLAEYFAQYNRIDISLDPFPYAGGTTTFDALWMGVPVVSLAGETAVGRGGVSILSQIGLEDLVCPSLDAYVSRAVSLASDNQRLSTLRRTLRDRLLASPLTNAPRFMRDVETAFRGMWQAWCGGGKGMV